MVIRTVSAKELDSQSDPLKVIQLKEGVELLTEVIPVLCPFAEGQGHMGVLEAPFEIYNGGFEALAKSIGWKIHPPVLPLEGIAEKEMSEEQNASDYDKYKVRNVRRVGYMLHQIYKAVKMQLEKGIFTVNLGGDHSVAGGTCAAALAVHPDLRILWVDAHADANNPDMSPSGNYHGMVLAHLMNWFVDELPGFDWLKNRIPCNHVGYIGLRDIDQQERKRLRNSDITVYDMRRIDKIGIYKALEEVLDTIDPDGTAPFHISFDVDSADPSVAPGTGTKCEGGLTIRECMSIVEYVREQRPLVSIDIVEVNVGMDCKEEPLHGDDPSIDTPYKTVKFALHLIRAALGFTYV